jgi:hypothetical protein
MMGEPGAWIRTSRLSVYHATEWGSRVSRVATISLAADGAYAVGWVPVVTVGAVGLFSVLTCGDGTAHVVLTAYLRLLHSEPPVSQGAL